LGGVIASDGLLEQVDHRIGLAVYAARKLPPKVR